MAKNAAACPNVDPTEERITVKEGVDYINSERDPKHNDGGYNSIIAVSFRPTPRIQHDCTSKDGGSREPTRVDGHTEPESNHFSPVEFIVDSSFTHNKSGHEHRDNDDLSKYEADSRIALEGG